MRPFRFHIPFFGSPSRLSSGASSSSPSPPPTPSPTRPPFRPAGIAQPPKPGTSPDTKSKVPSSPARVKTNVAAMASTASSSASQSFSPGTARRRKQSNQSGSPSKKLESEEPKASVEENPLKDSETKTNEATETKEAANINSVIQKPSMVGPEEAVKRKEAEAAAQEQSKKTVEQKPAVQERRKVLHKGSEEKSSVPESKSNEQKENTEAAQEQETKRKETKKRALQETKRALQVSREDATQSKTTRSIAAGSESTKGLRDPPETKTQNRTDIHGKSKDTNGEGSSMRNKIKEDVRNGISKLNLGENNGEEKSVRVVTLAGENKGATMQIASDKDKKDGEIHIRRGYRTNPDESPNSTATDNEEGVRTRENPKYNEENASITAYANNNSQGINNSIVFESSVKENDPGIHMSFRFEETKVKEIVNPPESVEEKKSETTVEKKLTETPRVRRRCLRGLFAESSDSAPENPLKPRRHGCRFTCKDKDKDKESMF